MPCPSDILAVLSGDLISSSSQAASLTEQAMARLERVSDDIAQWPGVDATHFTRFRGDGWQILLREPAYALRALLYMSANLLADSTLPNTRIAIGLGTVEHIPDSNLSAAAGQAFELSGRALDKLTKSSRFEVSGVGLTPLHQATLALVEELTSGWTPEQAEATAYYLLPTDPTLKEVAAQLGISTQAAHYRVRGAGGSAIRKATSLWEKQALGNNP